jgi:predicted nucleotidyltransferase
MIASALSNLHKWAGQAEAEPRRQWPVIADIADRFDVDPDLDALVLIGSFAKGTADEASDVDIIIAVSEGRFESAWEARSRLQPPDVVAAWDIRPDPEREVGSHRFLTREIVKVEILLAAPSSGVQLADPFVIIAGDQSAAGRFVRVPPIDPEVLSEYAQQLRDDAVLPEVELRYSDLMRAIRSAGFGDD